jgi:hypothetical protein
VPVTGILAHLERTAPERDQVELPLGAQTFIDLDVKPRHGIAGAFCGARSF